MKSYFNILLPAFLTLMILCSGIPDKNTGRNIPGEDTTGIRAVRLDSFMLQIIPPSSGVQFYKDKIVFLSLSKYERKMTPDQISFGAVETYYAGILDSVTAKHYIFLPGSSFKFPCEGMTFSSDYSTVYFSKVVLPDRMEKIFTAKISLNAENQPVLASEPVMLDICTGNSNYTHPALSSDGNTLIFASDRKGPASGMDLFISRQVNGKWSEPENMGREINTGGNEYFPFLDTDNNLYFSSDKLTGRGGYDIFTCRFNGTGWDKPLNLDYLNSGEDEIAFTMNKTEAKTAFFSRKSKGNFQLFKVSLPVQSKEQNLIALFNGKPPENLAENKIEEKQAPPAEPVKKEAEIAAKPGEQEVKKAATASAGAAGAAGAAAKKESKPVPANAVVIKPTSPLPDDQKDVVIYRVQILASQKPLAEKDIILNGEHYTLYEYYYLNAYRYSIGEFRTVPPAAELQKVCRKSGYNQAFVAAFKNNTRSVDLKTFR